MKDQDFLPFVSMIVIFYIIAYINYKLIFKNKKQ